MYGYNPVDSGDAEGGKWEYSQQFAAVEVRQGFIRKVFGLLAIQLLITAAASAAFIVSDGLKLFVSQNIWTVYVAMGLTLVIALMIGCCEGPRTTFPYNYILLFAFTLAESFLVGVISAAYDTNVVLMAFGLTVLITLGLTAFACQTKYDFTMMGGVLVGLLLTLVGASFILMFFPRTTIGTIAISSAGALIFCMYLVYDIQLLMGGRSHEYGPDDYVAATLAIYLDIVNLFLYLLQLINAVSGNRN